jgi:translocation and assembly module TamA
VPTAPLDPAEPELAMHASTRARGPAAIAAIAHLAAVLALILVAGEARAAAVNVTIAGLPHKLQQNVRSVLTIADPPRDRLAESDVRRFHDQAPAEIRRALEPFGYYRPLIRSELLRQGATWHARYTVDAGPPTRLDTVDVKLVGPGAAEAPFRRWLRLYPLKRGDVLDHSEYERAKGELAELAALRGYLDARFERSQVRVDPDSSVAVLELHFDTGRRYRFGPVLYHQDTVDPKLLEGSANFRRGEPYDGQRVIELQSRLGDNPWFERVEIDPRPDQAENDEVPIHVTLIPNKPEKYTVGGGYGTDTGVHGRAGAELRRINRSGHRARVDGALSRIESGIGGQYQIPWPRPRSDVLSLTSSYSERHTITEDSRTTRGGAAMTRLRYHWDESYGIQYRHEAFTVGPQRGVSRLLTPELTATRVKADNRVDPWNAHRVRLSLRGAEARVLSDVSFLQAELAGKVIAPLGGRSRAIVRSELGTTATAGFDRLPPSFRFFAGGAQSVRGYAFRELGPTVGGYVVGGPHLLTASLELEHRLRTNWGVAAFYDIGNAVRSFSDPLEQGTGLGLRWRSPIGLMRVDAAWAVSRTSRPLRWHLRMGPEL